MTVSRSFLILFFNSLSLIYFFFPSYLTHPSFLSRQCINEKTVVYSFFSHFSFSVAYPLACQYFQGIRTWAKLCRIRWRGICYLNEISWIGSSRIHFEQPQHQQQLQLNFLQSTHGMCHAHTYTHTATHTASPFGCALDCGIGFVQ